MIWSGWTISHWNSEFVVVKSLLQHKGECVNGSSPVSSQMWLSRSSTSIFSLAVVVDLLTGPLSDRMSFWPSPSGLSSVRVTPSVVLFIDLPRLVVGKGMRRLNREEFVDDAPFSRLVSSMNLGNVQLLSVTVKFFYVFFFKKSRSFFCDMFFF